MTAVRNEYRVRTMTLVSTLLDPVRYPVGKIMGLLDAATGLFVKVLALGLFAHDMRGVIGLAPFFWPRGVTDAPAGSGPSVSDPAATFTNSSGETFFQELIGCFDTPRLTSVSGSWVSDWVCQALRSGILFHPVP